MTVSEIGKWQRMAETSKLSNSFVHTNIGLLIHAYTHKISKKSQYYGTKTSFFLTLGRANWKPSFSQSLSSILFPQMNFTYIFVWESMD